MTLGLDVQIKTDISSEPVSLDEMKLYLNVDNQYWDTLIYTLISSARTNLERYTGCTFGTKTLVSTFQQVASNIDIPYGPIQSITHVKSIDEGGVKTTLTAGTDYLITGNNFKNIRFFGIDTPIEIEYVAGYTSLPTDLKIAIMKQVAIDFQYRESTIEGSVTELSNSAKKTANTYRRILMF
jgi:uncharacterized phiE125 gp8 family phage protein